MAQRRRQFIFRVDDSCPDVITRVLLERGWAEFDEDEQTDDDWNLFWRTSRYRMSDYEQINRWQRLNHFPKTTAITRKDCLVRNLRKMRGIHGPVSYNFSPVAFNLPNEYTKFISEYTKRQQNGGQTDNVWICKPYDLSRGRGIFIFRNLSDLQYDNHAVVQRYITNPYLLAGYKFDLRIYVCVSSFSPLTVYMYKEGLVRFSTEKFDLGTIDNPYAHLTNTSINKRSPTYNLDKERVGPGCKWSLSQLRTFFHQSNVDDRLLWQRICNIITLTLLAQVPTVPKVMNCFDLFGFDIIIDENLKPWLLEVNFSPALGLDCQIDYSVKLPLIHDMIDMLSFTDSDKTRSRVQPKETPRRGVGPSLRFGAAAKLPSIGGSNQRGGEGREPSSHEEEDEGYFEYTEPLSSMPMSVPNFKKSESKSSLSSLGSSLSGRSTSSPPVETLTLPELEGPGVGTRKPGVRSSLNQTSTVARAMVTRNQALSKMPTRNIGDFVLTFPINEATLRASSSPTLDQRLVIQEVNKQMKVLIGEIKAWNARWAKQRTDVTVRKCSLLDRDSMLLWGPLNPVLSAPC